MSIKKGFYLLLFLTAFTTFSQSIKGVVLDGKTNEPIESASVYFDNTTIGTSTNDKGEFSLPYKEGIKSALIISYLGYQNVMIYDYQVNKLYKILMTEDVNTLDEVVISAIDSMPRAMKLEHFRKQFLGFSDAAKSCTILNEDDLILKYNYKKKQLTAKAKKPILVQNEDLQYLVSFQINEFTIDYSYANITDKHFHIKSVIYTGTTFYQPLEEAESQKTIKNRNKTYEGSVVHFMRALSKKTLEAEGYQIFSSGFLVKPENYIRVKPIENTNVVTVKMLKPLSILYNKNRQSEMQSLVDEFTIDEYGNHSPLQQVLFSGDMGNQRVGNLLPFDYELLED